MFKNRLIFGAVAAVLLFVILKLTDNLVASVIATLLVVTISYFILAFKRSQNRLGLLEDKCDPETFIRITEKQIKVVSKKPNVKAFLEVDKAAGLIYLGKFEEAKEELVKINESVLSEKNGAKLIYSINLVTALYALNEFEEAEDLFMKDVDPTSSANSYLRRAVSLLAGERLYHLKKYDESKELLTNLLKDNVTKKEELTIIYRLGLLAQIENNQKQACEKFTQVYEEGPKLWIGQQAKEHLNK